MIKRANHPQLEKNQRSTLAEIARAAKDGSGNGRIEVAFWENTYRAPILQTFVAVNPRSPQDSVVNLIVCIASADRRIYYVYDWAIPEIQDNQVAVPGAGIASLAQTELYDPAVRGPNAIAFIGGYVGTIHDQEPFYLEQSVTF